MIKVLSIFGTRPEVIKMAPIVHALALDPAFKSRVCTTSQHRTMQDQMMALFNLTADYDLNIMQPNQTLTDITVNVLRGLEQLFKRERFDWVLVHGDTGSCAAAALAAFYARIPVAHVEAGLRTYNLDSPYPEEANRQLTGRLARCHFAPTELAWQNLLEEHVDAANIVVTGNTVIDALLYMREQIRQQKVSVQLPPVLERLKAEGALYGLITGHRRESFGEGFLQICNAIKTLSLRYPHWHFVYPVHLNPQVQAPVKAILGQLPNVHLIDPVDYAPFVVLMEHCQWILTDSGGVQEEAPSLGKPVLVMREITERPEGIAAGTARLVGNREASIVDNVVRLIEDKAFYQRMANAVNPYGDGQAAQRIVEALKAR